MAKRAGRVKFMGQSSPGSKWVIFKRVNRVAGRVGSVDLYFSNKFFFFFEIGAICQLSSSTVIRFSLVILLLITTRRLISKFGATLVPVF